MNQHHEVAATQQREGSKFTTAIVLALIAAGFFLATVTGLFF
jgi:hypothetical protein